MVYVDALKDYGRPIFGHSKWCHMITDGDVEELHKFAGQIGLKREWFQAKHQHYDLTETRRCKALAAGAKVATKNEFAQILAKRK